jgi:tetratricopeptide (TPR) repeat protein
LAAPVVAQTSAQLDALVNRAIELRTQNKLAEAEPLFRQAAQMAPTVHGANHQNTALVVGVLANTLRDQGKIAEAEPLYKQCLTIFEATLGVDHQHTISTRSNLAGIYQQQNKLDQAETLLTVALKSAEKTLGATHADTGLILNQLGDVYGRQGKLAMAEPLLRRGLAIREAANGPEHAEVAQSLNNLGHLYLAQGKQNEAAAAYQRCLTILEKTTGTDHPNYVSLLSNLGTVWTNQGRLADAEAMHQRSLQIREKIFPPGHPEIASGLMMLATVARSRGKTGEAEALLQRAIAIREKAFGATHVSLVPVLSGLAAIYDSQGRPAEAEPLLRRCLTIVEAVAGPQHSDVAVACVELGSVLMAQKNFAGAEPLFQRALTIREKTVGPNHPDTASAVGMLASLKNRQGQVPAAVELYRRALQMLESVHGVGHPNTAATLASLAELLQTQGKFAEAMPFHDRQRRAGRRFLMQEFPGMATRDQLEFLANDEAPRFQAAISLGWHLAKSGANTDQSAEWLLNAKSAAIEAMTASMRIEVEAGDGEGRAMLLQLQKLQSELASVLREPVNPLTAAARNLRQKSIEEQLKGLEAKLASISPTSAKQSRLWVPLADVRRSIPAGAVLIDLVRLTPRNVPVGGTASRYVAWVIPAAGSTPVAVVDLGESAPLDAAIQAAREAIIKKDASAVTKLGQLSNRLIKPLRPHLSGVRSLIVSPDAELWLAPWAALATGKDRFLIEEFSLRLVMSGRDLLSPASTPVATSPATILADPDFDAKLGAAGLVGRSAVGQLGGMAVHFTFARSGRFTVRLGTLSDGEVIGSGTWQQDGDAVRMESERSAYQGRWHEGQWSGRRRRKDMPNLPEDAWAMELTRSVDPGVPASAKIGKAARLSAAGEWATAFIAELKRVTKAEVVALTGAPASEAAAKAAIRPKLLAFATAHFSVSASPGAERENPLACCGLFLAGGNHRADAKPGSDDGVLTGLEIAACDLLGTDVVVLNTVEMTPATAPGEGVAALRQAFLLAGSNAVLASQWAVGINESVAILTRFTEQRGAGKSKADALRDAQLHAIRETRGKGAGEQSLSWAAFTLTGN